MITKHDLEESLSEILPEGFSIEMTDDGEIIIFTGLKEEDGVLLPVSFDDDFDSDFDVLDDDED